MKVKLRKMMRIQITRYVILLVMMVSFFPEMNFAQSLRFTDEIITVHISENRVLLTGQYLFQNSERQPLDMRLYYPFPINEHLLYPDSIVVTDQRVGKTTRFREAPLGIYFPVTLPPADSAWYQVVYAQHINQNSFTYILTTTHAWNQPLRSARYIVKLPYSLRLTAISLLPDTTIQKDSYQEIRILRKNFMPDKDLMIQWKKK